MFASQLNLTVKFSFGVTLFVAGVYFLASLV